MIPILERFVLAVGGSFPASIVAKATVIAMFTLISTRLARRSRAAVRHVLLTAAFGGLLLLPVISFVAPPVEIGIETVGHNGTGSAPVTENNKSVQSVGGPESQSVVRVAAPKSTAPSLPMLLVTAWLVGAALCLVPMIVGLSKIRSLRQSGLPWADCQEILNRLARDAGIRRRVEVLLNERLPGPIAVGILYPAILLPLDAENWERENLNRALLHELEHVRRGDTVVHSLARAACAVYWFHPMVWSMWRQVTLESERSCDDAVIARSEATGYAEQLVGLAHQLSTAAKSPVLYMANRSDLAIRVGAVLDARQRRGRAGRWMVAIGCAVAGVLVFTISPLRTVSSSPSATTQAATPNLKAIGESSPSFEVASIKPDRSPGATRFEAILPNRFNANHVTAKTLICFAFGVHDFQISGGPDWVDSAEYDIASKPDDTEKARLAKLTWKQYREECGQLVHSLLAERFKLKVSLSTKVLPVYALVIAKGGVKLAPSKAPQPTGKRGPWISIKGGQLNSLGISMTDLADTLTGIPDLVGRQVQDRTGLTGNYDLSLYWTPDEHTSTMLESSESGKSGKGYIPPSPSTGPSLFTAIQEQLGLKLVATKGAVETIVIDHIERPSEN